MCLRNRDVYFTRHQHKAIYKKCNFTERGEKDLFVIDDGEKNLCLRVISNSKPRDGYWISGTEGALVAD